jgi:17 kDa common-antigen outer membrane protein
MFSRSDASRCPDVVRTGFRLARPLPMLALAALALTGCAGQQRPAEAPVTGPQPIALAPGAAVPALPGDPIAAFAATATPGAERQVVLPGTGRSTRVRLLRAYNAASGRECREVLVGTGFEERSALVCRQEEGWATARPLLQRGGTRAP